MTSPKIAFVYLLNRMENAASAKEPFKAGFGEHRQAVVEHVNRIETELADARAALTDLAARAPAPADLIRLLKLCSLDDVYQLKLNVELYDFALESARKLLAKQG